MSPIIISQLHYTFPIFRRSSPHLSPENDSTISVESHTLFQNLSISFPQAATGIVGDNGTGKSTLLKLIAQELTPDAGSISIHGNLSYLPQDLTSSSHKTVADALGIAKLLSALQAIEAGSGMVNDFDLLEGQWDFLHRIEIELTELDFHIQGYDQSLDTFSGGQIMLLGLIGAFSLNPDIILLDEPTNNLDTCARRWLEKRIQNYSGCLLLVSHDRALLDQMDYIAELYQGKLAIYQGKYSTFQENQMTLAKAIEHQIKDATKVLKQEKRELQVAMEKAQKSSQQGKRNSEKRGLPKIIIGAMQRSAEESQGKKRNMYQAKISQAQEDLIAIKNTARMKNKIDPIFPHVNLPAGKPIITAFHANAQYNNQWIFQPPGIHLSLVGPQKVALTGPNGSGKTSLLHMLTGKLPLASGELTIDRKSTALISQSLDGLNPDLTIEENLQVFNPTLTEQNRRNILAHFLFRKDTSQKIVKTLSGGELVKAHLACILFQTQFPTLLLIDELTNNLDITSTNHIISALNTYQGAVIVISHDEYFLSELHLDRRWELSQGILNNVAW